MFRHRGRDVSPRASDGGRPSSTVQPVADLLDHKLPLPFLPSLCLVGGLELWSAVRWGHQLGALAGAVAFLAGASLQAMQRLPRTRATLEQRLRWPLTGLLAYLVLLLVIHLASPDPPFTVFPDSCAPSKSYCCARLSAVAPNPPNDKPPPEFTYQLSDVGSLVEQWVAEERGMRILGIYPSPPPEKTVFMHMRALSFFWGFADDVLISLEMKHWLEPGQRKKSAIVLTGQGQARLGKSDLGVNARRLRLLLDDVVADLGWETTLMTDFDPKSGVS